jgi:acyl-CoA reductase-like NAD-dependent aldehyde dehydrogenase
MTVTRALLIGGKEVDALDGGVTDDLDPFTGEVVARVAAAGKADVTRAVDAADAAFAEWSRSDPNDRRRVLLAAADLLEHRASDIAEVMVSETGSIRGWGAFNVGLAGGMLREAAGLTTAPVGEVLTTSTPGSMSLALRQPAGVVAAFAPWNAPVILGVRSVAVALAVGNTVVMKPSEEAPLSAALLLADVLGEAGIPDGVVNVITNAPPDAATIAEALISDPRVRRVNFTGSTRVGRIIAQTAALHLKPAVLELGGKNALVILSDADVDYAVDAVSFGAYMNSGQICMSTDRVIVDRSLAAEFTQRLAAKASGLPSGDPRLPTTLIGQLLGRTGGGGGGASPRRRRRTRRRPLPCVGPLRRAPRPRDLVGGDLRARMHRDRGRRDRSRDRRRQRQRVRADRRRHHRGPEVRARSRPPGAYRDRPRQ